EAQRRQLLPMLARRTRSMHDFLARAAADRLEPWARLWREGHGDAWRGDSEFIERRVALWEQALLS
ncbi:MAG: aminoglycoside phosphotransferase family protein, partial [Candidatus Dormibacteraeota bacterium]|nr:aminoglycoside phosphotransferase family protein [Candidatus Dormibacteraeota bacterium]